MTSIAIAQPTLVVDGVVGKSSPEKQEILYTEIESAHVFIPAVANNTQSSGNYVFNWFNGKLLGRGLVQNIPTGTINANRDIKEDANASQLESFKVRINGCLKFPNRIDSHNEKLVLCADAFGGLNVAQGTQWVKLDGGDLFLHSSTAAHVYCILSYGACVGGQRIKEFEVDCTRVGSNDVKDNMGVNQFHLEVSAEIGKVLSVRKSAVVVSYA